MASPLFENACRRFLPPRLLACVEFALQVSARGAALLVSGDERSDLLPDQLRPYLVQQPGEIKVNFLVNCGREWDFAGLSAQGALRSQDVSPVDMVGRWGGGCRLSGFLPVQCAYAAIRWLAQTCANVVPAKTSAVLESPSAVR